MDISERLRELRKSRKLTQKQVSAATGITGTGYQNYELGTRTPRLEQLLSLADFYGVTLDYLTGRVDDPHGNALKPAEDPEGYMNEPDSTFLYRMADRLKQVRKASGMTQQSVADAAQISPSTYRAYESGTSMPLISTILRVAAVLNVSADYLFGSTDDIHGKPFWIDEPDSKDPGSDG